MATLQITSDELRGIQDAAFKRGQELLMAKEPSSPYKEFNKKNNPSAYPKPGEGQQQQYEMEPGGQLKLPIKGVNRNLMINPQIAHRDHTPNFRLDGIDRYITTDKHDPSQHDIPVDDYGRPIPSLKPTDLQIDKQNLPGNMIDPSLYDDADMLLSELNAEQLKILKTIPSDLNKRSPAERLKIMRDIHGKVMEKA